MAYIPGLKHDLFLSYAHQDLDWVNELSEHLGQRLEDKLACAIDVWHDVNKIRAGQKWADEIETGVKSSAAFLAVLSRHYQKSEWCEKERDYFLAQCREAKTLEADGSYRFLKVVKYPWRNDEHEKFEKDFQHVKFFDCDSKTGLTREFKTTSAAYQTAVERLAHDIEQLFDAMLRSKEKLLVAWAADDCAETRKTFLREVKANGYAI